MPPIALPTPADYRLARDVCSYGYFLLEPNRWDVTTQTLTRTLNLAGHAAVVRLAQKAPDEPVTALLRRPLPARGRTAAKAELLRQLTRMLRLDEPESTVRDFHRADPRWKKSGRARLFRSPTFFEDVIKTVTSCNVTWPSTVAMNRRLCAVVGAPAEGFPAPPSDDPDPPDEHAAFPEHTRLARTRAATLRARCRVGYRDARIIELARLFTTGRVDTAWFENPATPDDDIHAALLELPGIGPYAAANIMQLLGRYARLPLDTESVRHGRDILGYKGSSAQIMRKVHDHFTPFGAHAFRSYWFEMWTQYEKIAGPAHTWKPRATANTFTAATLKKAALDAQRALSA